MLIKVPVLSHLTKTIYNKNIVIRPSQIYVEVDILFNGLGKKMTLALSVSLSLFVVFTSITLYYIISKSIYTSYVNTSIQYTNQKLQNLNIYMGLVKETSKLLSNNVEILEALKEKKPRASIETILDGIKSTYNDFSTVGIYLYSFDRITYSSSNISNMPLYNDLIIDLNLNEFLDSDQDSLWTIRDKNIKEVIKIQVLDEYNSAYGLLTYISKIFDANKKFIGLLIINVDIMKIYDLFDSKSPEFFGQASSYILKDSKILPYPSISKTLDSQLESRIIHDKISNKPIIYNNNIVFYNDLFSYSNIALVIIIPLSPFLNYLNKLIVLFAIVSILFIVYFTIVSKLISKSITLPLNKLNKKMRKPI